MGKTSLANTFAEFLKNPTEDSKPVLTKGTDLEFTKVMQLYDGLSVNQKKKVVVQVKDLPRNESVKLVKLKMDQEESKKDVTRSSPLASAAETSSSTNKEKMAQTGTSSFQHSVLPTEASPANEGTESLMSKTSKTTFEGNSSPSVSQKAGKRERFKKMFTSLFTRAPDKTLLANEEETEKEEPEDDVDFRNPNQEKPARAPGETSDDESPSRSENGNKNDVQLKLVDMGGHSATIVLTSNHCC